MKEATMINNSRFERLILEGILSTPHEFNNTISHALQHPTNVTKTQKHNNANEEGHYNTVSSGNMTDKNGNTHTLEVSQATSHKPLGSKSNVMSGHAAPKHIIYSVKHTHNIGGSESTTEHHFNSEAEAVNHIKTIKDSMK